MLPEAVAMSFTSFGDAIKDLQRLLVATEQSLQTLTLQSAHKALRSDREEVTD